VRTHSHDERGFTLAELIIAIAILGILFTFFITAMGQTLIITAKVQTRDKALAIAQDELEKMRNTLIIPDGPVTTEDEKWPGYFVTITSTRFLDTNGISYVQFLRNVTVTVSGPTSAVTLRTNIQTYRPQISFFLPVADQAYIRDKTTVLEGLIRDDGYSIAVAQVKYRTRPGTTGTWGSWTILTTLYLDQNRQSVATPTLQVGQTYYFSIPIVGTGNDGTVQEIQVQATNSGNYVNEQPSQPFGGTSYVRVITDKTKPTATATLFPTTSVTTGSQLRFTMTASDPITGGVASGIYEGYVLISKTPTVGGILYWQDTGTAQIWSSTKYYWTATASDPEFYYQWLPEHIPLAYEPGAVYTFQGFLPDNVIGKYFNYRNYIPIQGANTGSEFIWSDGTNIVNANFLATTPLSLTMHPMPIITTGTATTITATTATLRGSANPGGLPSNVWFEYKPISGSWIATTTASRNGVVQVDFAEAVNLLSGTQYVFHACINNDWGTFHGVDVPFTTLTP
jgi:prepilin-type N-terminal cleavage/methylation domain-containing protein